MEQADYRQLNGIALAYLGDAVYEVFIRQHLLSKGLSKPTKLQHIATHYVSAKAQAALIDLMKADELLTDEEWAYFKRGRNAKSATVAKHASVIDYRKATGLEALVGWLFLMGQYQRLTDLVSEGLKRTGLMPHPEDNARKDEGDKTDHEI